MAYPPQYVFFHNYMICSQNAQFRSLNRNSFNTGSQNLILNSQIQNQGVTKQIDKYIFDSKDVIGKGQFSFVYKGKNQINNDTVAIKVIDSKKITEDIFFQLMENEIQILSVLKSQCLIKFYDTFRTANNIYIITEYFEEGDLEKLLKKKKTLPEKQIVDILGSLVGTLKELRNYEIIHRDVKPANILFSKGSPKLADYGFAICYKLQKDQVKIICLQMFKRDVMSGFNIGTPLFMAPESLLKNIYTYKSDIWAMGIVFYQMLYGDTPFFCLEQNELSSKLKQFQKDKKLPIKNKKVEISQQAKDLLARMLEFSADKRIDLDEILKHPFLKQIVSANNSIQDNNVETSSSKNSKEREEVSPIKLDILPPKYVSLSKTKGNGLCAIEKKKPESKQLQWHQEKPSSFQLISDNIEAQMRQINKSTPLLLAKVSHLDCSSLLISRTKQPIDDLHKQSSINDNKVTQVFSFEWSQMASTDENDKNNSKEELLRYFEIKIEQVKNAYIYNYLDKELKESNNQKCLKYESLREKMLYFLSKTQTIVNFNKTIETESNNSAYNYKYKSAFYLHYQTLIKQISHLQQDEEFYQQFSTNTKLDQNFLLSFLTYIKNSIFGVSLFLEIKKEEKQYKDPNIAPSLEFHEDLFQLNDLIEYWLNNFDIGILKLCQTPDFAQLINKDSYKKSSVYLQRILKLRDHF